MPRIPKRAVWHRCRSSAFDECRTLRPNDSTFVVQKRNDGYRVPERSNHVGQPGFPLRERHAGMGHVSQGRCPEASRMPRPMMISLKERSTGTAVSPKREQNVVLGVASSAGLATPVTAIEFSSGGPFARLWSQL
jgi:hypothetical protein